MGCKSALFTCKILFARVPVFGLYFYVYLRARFARTLSNRHPCGVAKLLVYLFRASANVRAVFLCFCEA